MNLRRPRKRRNTLHASLFPGIYLVLVVLLTTSRLIHWDRKGSNVFTMIVVCQSHSANTLNTSVATLPTRQSWIERSYQAVPRSSWTLQWQETRDNNFMINPGNQHLSPLFDHRSFLISQIYLDLVLFTAFFLWIMWSRDGLQNPTIMTTQFYEKNWRLIEMGQWLRSLTLVWQSPTAQEAKFLEPSPKLSSLDSGKIVLMQKCLTQSVTNTSNPTNNVSGLRASPPEV